MLDDSRDSNLEDLTADGEGVGDALRLRRGADGPNHWMEVVDDRGRQVGVVEGCASDGTFDVTRAHVAEHAHADAATEMFRTQLSDSGLTVRVADHALPPPPNGRRSIVAELGGIDDPGRRVEDGSAIDATGPSSNERPDISAMHAADYLEAPVSDWERLGEQRDLGADPRNWIDLVNPGHDDDLRRLESGLPVAPLNRVENCADCARSVQDTLDGQNSVAAAGRVETTARIVEWAGEPGTPADSFGDVAKRLRNPGDSAVLAASFDNGVGHAFNAVNIDGVVSYVDGQTGEVGEWPPPFAEDTTHLEAWYFEKGHDRD